MSGEPKAPEPRAPEPRINSGENKDNEKVCKDPDQTSIDFSERLNDILKNKKMPLSLKRQQIEDLKDKYIEYVCEKKGICSSTSENLGKFNEIFNENSSVISTNIFDNIQNEYFKLIDEFGINLDNINNSLAIEDSLSKGELNLNLFANNLNNEFLDSKIVNKGFKFIELNKQHRQEFLEIYKKIAPEGECNKNIKELIDLELKDNYDEIIAKLGEKLNDVQKEEFKKEFEIYKKENEDHGCTLEVIKFIKTFFAKNDIDIEAVQVKEITKTIQKNQNQALEYSIFDNKALINELGFQNDGKDFSVFLSENSSEILKNIDFEIEELENIISIEKDKAEILKLTNKLERYKKLKTDLEKYKKSNIQIKREKIIEADDYKKVMEFQDQGITSKEEIMGELEKQNEKLKKYNKEVKEAEEKEKQEKEKKEKERKEKQEKEAKARRTKGSDESEGKQTAKPEIAQNAFFTRIDSLKEGEILPIRRFPDSFIKLNDGGTYTVKIGDQQHECKDKEQLKLTLKTFRYLGRDLGLRFLIPHIKQIIQTIKTENKNNGQDFSLNDGLQDAEKIALLKVLGQVFFKPNTKEKNIPTFTPTDNIQEMEKYFKAVKDNGNGKIKMDYICKIQGFKDSGGVFLLTNFLTSIKSGN